MTAIFRVEQGAWKLVHLHHSIGVPDEEVEMFRDVLAAAADPPVAP